MADHIALQVAKKYDVPADMIKALFKRTKKGYVNAEKGQGCCMFGPM